MYTGLLHLHSVLRWVILILLLIAVYKSIADRNKAFTPGHRKTALILLICCDIMLLLGIYQWVAGTKGLESIQTNGMAVVMKNPTLRFFAVEHLVAMIIAIALVHIGYSYAKKNIPDTVKHKRTLLFFGLALIIIIISIPWPFRVVGEGRHWLPGM
jgi:phosphotransferase system  glucose/maltose/N-acetylglucosamine-specific IIC component